MTTVGAIAARKKAVSHLDAVIPPASATSKVSASTRFWTVRTPQWSCPCDPAIGKGEVASEMLARGGIPETRFNTGGGRDEVMSSPHHFQTLIVARDRLDVASDGRVYAFEEF